MRVLNTRETALVGGGRRKIRYSVDIKFGSRTVRTAEVVEQAKKTIDPAR